LGKELELLDKEPQQRFRKSLLTCFNVQKFGSLGSFSWSEVKLKGWFLSNKPPWCKAIKPPKTAEARARAAPRAVHHVVRAGEVLT
jgi:hypothetical protein